MLEPSQHVASSSILDDFRQLVQRTASRFIARNRCMSLQYFDACPPTMDLRPMSLQVLVVHYHNDESPLDFVDIEDTRCLVVSEELDSHRPCLRSPYPLEISTAFGRDSTLL
ncbi:hypothetical protein SISNIDRAFT_458839 [Sistotremastrum niveocremeum HHB9708]|uniref:Uncharacterized protein n=1 Tax=Sistotremastrum niveocremeum HHB9708 TaxID=1314777 RepID=A0A164Q5J1_9AGAM|nr:hypothetical protein SISNIDRAFT_458839 [Sistotremastrum niveocremeum HHB9708]